MSLENNYFVALLSNFKRQCTHNISVSFQTNQTVPLKRGKRKIASSLVSVSKQILMAPAAWFILRLRAARYSFIFFLTARVL